MRARASSSSPRSATATSASPRRRTRTSPATLQAAVDRVNALPQRPAFVLHTGDITPALRSRASSTRRTRSSRRCKTERVFLRPRRARRARRQRASVSRALRQGRARAAAGTASTTAACTSSAWSTCSNLKAGGLGNLGAEQLDWLKTRRARASRAARRSSCSPTCRSGPSTPSGAGAPTTASRRSALLKRFGSVTVLNGHIHQVMQKVEGNVRFHTAMSTAFPQPAPGTAPVARADEGRARTGCSACSASRASSFCRGHQALAVVDSPLDKVRPARAPAPPGRPQEQWPDAPWPPRTRPARRRWRRPSDRQLRFSPPSPPLGPGPPLRGSTRTTCRTRS